MNKFRDKISYQTARLINSIRMAKFSLWMPLNT